MLFREVPEHDNETNETQPAAAWLMYVDLIC